MSKKLVAAAVAALALAGCANVALVPAGETVVAGKVSLRLDDAWNQLNLPNRHDVTWTMEGLTVDQLVFYVDVKPGDHIGPPAVKEQRPLQFKAGMQPHEIVALFEGLNSRDGSAFTLDKLEPADFMGEKGFRFQYTVVRKFDSVRLSGEGWGAVHQGDLYVMTYTAPRAGFFPRYALKVEQIAKSARFKS
jgi:hypothetical protein